MGFSFSRPEPYPLSGYGIAYALLNNRHFIPGRDGSLIAIGSVSEPFHPLLVKRTVEFLEAADRFLRNPTQFSTKQFIDEGLAGRMASLKLPINPLITIVTVEKLGVLEPRAPPLEVRLKTIENLSNAGLKPMVFVRPIIPGVTDVEARVIGELAASHGAVGAVIGTLRVTRRIIERLSKVMDVGPILRRLKRTPRPGEQLAIRGADLKMRVREELERAGLKVFDQACVANAYNAQTYPACYRMNRCRNCILDKLLGKPTET